jgi:formate dehydrogenase subunit delta
VRIETLTRMAQEIAVNNGVFPEDEATRRVADHLRSFWTPAMRRDFTAYVTEHPDAVDPVVRAALES